MLSAKKITGLAIAAAAAGIFAMTPIAASAGAASTDVKCMGVNACKGKSSCKTAGSSCKGLNSCKGQGFVQVSKSVCDQLGGKAG